MKRVSDELRREHARERQRRYVVAHPERVAAAKARWRKENPEQMQACREAWISAGDNKAKRRKSILAWQARNADKVRADTKKYREKNRDRIRAWITAWEKRNPHKRLTYAKRRQAAKILAIPKWADLDAIAEVYQEAAYFQLQVDHIVPLRSKLVCGLHVVDNLQLLTAAENSAKGNRYWPDMP